MPRQLMLGRMPARLLWREHVQVDEHLRLAVVPGQPGELPCPQQIDAAVAHIRAHRAAAGDVQGRQCGAHAPASALHSGADGLIGALHALCGGLPGALHRRGAQRLYGHQRRQLAALLAAHAVSHSAKERAGRAAVMRASHALLHLPAKPALQVKVILVIATHVAHMTADTGADSHSHRIVLPGITRR